MLFVSFVFNKLSAEKAAPPLRFDDGLVAGPEEIILADQIDKPAAFHHLARVIVDAREHECAALLVQSFMQMMNGFESRCIHQRYTMHGKDERVGVSQIRKRFIELTSGGEKEGTR